VTASADFVVVSHDVVTRSRYAVEIAAHVVTGTADVQPVSPNVFVVTAIRHGHLIVKIFIEL
jgi:hypothetical protein